MSYRDVVISVIEQRAVSCEERAAAEDVKGAGSPERAAWLRWLAEQMREFGASLPEDDYDALVARQEEFKEEGYRQGYDDAISLGHAEEEESGVYGRGYEDGKAAGYEEGHREALTMNDFAGCGTGTMPENIIPFRHPGHPSDDYLD